MEVVLFSRFRFGLVFRVLVFVYGLLDLGFFFVQVFSGRGQLSGFGQYFFEYQQQFLFYFCVRLVCIQFYFYNRCLFILLKFIWFQFLLIIFLERDEDGNEKVFVCLLWVCVYFFLGFREGFFRGGGCYISVLDFLIVSGEWVGIVFVEFRDKGLFFFQRRSIEVQRLRKGLELGVFFFQRMLYQVLNFLFIFWFFSLFVLRWIVYFILVEFLLFVLRGVIFVLFLGFLCYIAFFILVFWVIS